MARIITSNQKLNQLVEMTDMERENLILKKQQQVITIQRDEVRREFIEKIEELRDCQDYLAGKKVNPREKYTLEQFMEKSPGGGSLLLQEAMKFYETHDGCPLYECSCNQSARARCESVWIRMGLPCSHLMERLQYHLDIRKKRR
ncbi:MAG: hypothetical protein ACTSUE_06960 [Promethearchaeota archaeon]